jgi:hypothetical protein
MQLLTAGGLAVVHPDIAIPVLAFGPVIACIQTAVAAQAGFAKDVAVEHERAQWRCEMTLVDKAGTRL